MRTKIFRPELGIYIPIFLFGGIFGFLSFQNAGLKGVGDLISYYFFNFFWSPLKESFFWLLIALLFILIFRLLVFGVSEWGKKANFDFSIKEGFPKILKSAFFDSKEILKVLAPVFLGVFFLALALGEVNALSRYNLKDELLMGLDAKFFGGYAFVSLASRSYPPFFVKLVEFSFSYLGAFLIFAGFCIFYADKSKFRKFAAAFSWSLVIMFPLWVFWPALSPQDRFINNVYSLPVPSDIAEKIASYRPQAETAEFLNEIRILKEKLKDMPTSTMPSAHTAWATIGAYFLYRGRKILGLMFLPLFLLSVLGTVFLAQHYFVDSWGGAVIGVLAIFIAGGRGKPYEPP